MSRPGTSVAPARPTPSGSDRPGPRVTTTPSPTTKRSRTSSDLLVSRGATSLSTMPRLRVLDLFAGLGGWSSAFRERGHDVVTLDYDPRFGTTVTADVTEVTAEHLGGPGAYDVIVASPPCEGFSVASIGRCWSMTKDGVASPKHATSELGVRIALYALDLIRELAPPAGFVIENPTGMMRHVLDSRVHRIRHYNATPTAPSVTYCRLGFDYRKPTDLWADGPLVAKLDLPAPCDTDRHREVVLDDGRRFRIDRRTGTPCHEVAERGARTGVQGLADSAARALVPTALSAAIADAVEALELPGGPSPVISWVAREPRLFA